MTDQDLPMVLAWRNHPEIRKYMYTRHEIGEKEHIEWWNSINFEKQIPLIHEIDGTRIGYVNFKIFENMQGVASWAFYASPDAPIGSGAKMEYLALEHFFFVLKLHRLECEVLATNTTVLRLHQKFGFQMEGRYRERYFDGNSYTDVIAFGMLANEWHEKRSAMSKKIERL